MGSAERGASGRPPRRRGRARIGIYGGTFNPIHIAHLLLGQEAGELFGLDRVLFVPSGMPPHKRGRFPSGRDRLAMVRMAVEGNGRFGVLDLEVRRRGPSYTVETLQELRRLFPAGTEFYFLLGMDAFREITTWHEAESLADLAHLLVFARPGFPLEDPGPYLPRRWTPGTPVRRSGSIRRIPTGRRHSVFLFDAGIFPVSATDIRRRVRQRKSIRYLVPDLVRDYIRRKRLYQNRNEGG